MSELSMDEYETLFNKQYGDLPVGGFLNPKIVERTSSTIIFRCHYNNFEMEDDSWHYYFDIGTKTFC